MKIFSNRIILLLIIVALVILGYFLYKADRDRSSGEKVDDSKLSFSEQNSQLATSDSIESKSYQNSDHGITINYPENWFTADLGGDKNITSPDVRENIIYFYDAKDQIEVGKDSQDIFASVKIISYVLDSSIKIDSDGSWFNYVKDKVESYKSSSLAEASQYNLISVDKKDNINGNWAVEEQYLEIGGVKAKDIYLYHDGQFYQLICKTKENSYSAYLPYFDLVINSFKIGQ